MSIFLGFDSSTQGLKTILIDTESGTCREGASVNFGKDLPEFKSPNGYLENANPLIRHANPLLWAAALDLVCRKMRDSGIPLDRVAGISGSGQQHGSVYLNACAEKILASLDPAHPLAAQLAPALSRTTSPIWMDRSTHAACQELRAAFRSRMRRDTGSDAIERFTGPQIRHFAQTEPEAWKKTEHVALVSSFMASVLTGRIAPVDYGDGAGMNLLNLRTLDWDAEIVEFTAPDLRAKLPRAVPGHTVIGGLSPYFEQYGFRAGTPVSVWTGDNPASLIGTGGGLPGTAVVSLGTSDTLFAAMTEFRTDPEGCGHVFGNPAGGFMSLICFSNGSLARDRMRRECGVGWTFFDETSYEHSRPTLPPKLMLPYFEPECTPPVLRPGVTYNFDFAMARPEEKIRALLESQALSMELHSAWMGETIERLRVTGGASNSHAIRHILADVFQSPVERLAQSSSAALGAAMLAAAAVDKIPMAQLTAQFCAPVDTTLPDYDLKTIYCDARQSFAELEGSR